jgi:colanic acid/amylovoran biosynthesis glycosyltransferase
LKTLKIGLILNNYPKLSEPFIDAFITHIEPENEIYLLAQFTKNKFNNKSLTFIPYVSPKGHRIWSKIHILIKLFYYFKRFYFLRKKGLSSKLLIVDAGILTLPKLDYLHFPFANLAFGRELYAEVLGAKMSVSFRGSDLNVYPVFHKLSYNNILKKVDKIHCNSIELKEKLLKHQFEEFDKVSIIHSAIREDYKIDNKDLIANIQNRDYSKETFVTVGRLHWVKDYALTFETLGLLKILGYQFDYKIIGDGPEKEHLVFLADFYDITENVHFLGARNSNEIKEELQLSTMYLQTSLAEGFSNSCLEAQSQGLLCVVTDVSGMSACIEDNVTGYILKERNSEYMKECILKLMNLETVERNKRELYASERVFSKFSQQIQKQAWINFFNS